MIFDRPVNLKNKDLLPLLLSILDFLYKLTSHCQMGFVNGLIIS